MALLRPGARTLILLLLAALAGTEFTLRQRGFAVVAAAEPDPVLGWRKQPGHRARGISGEGEHINGHGFRDRDWAEPAAPELPLAQGGQAGLRVALLGDSVAYAARVPVEQGLGRVMEEVLEERLEAEVLVQNFSMPGWTLAQMTRAYEEVARAWQPDLVLLVINSGCLREPLPTAAARDFPLRRVIQRSAIYDYLQRRTLDRPEVHAEQVQGYLENLRQVEHGLYEHEAAPIWERAREQLARLHTEVRKDGGQLALIYVPQLRDLYGDAWKAHREGPDLAAEHWGEVLKGLDDLLWVDLRLTLRERVAPIVTEGKAQDLRPMLIWGRKRDTAGEALAAALGSPYLSADPLHLSPEGHQLVAANLLLEIERAGWLPPAAKKD